MVGSVANSAQAVLALLTTVLTVAGSSLDAAGVPVAPGVINGVLTLIGGIQVGLYSFVRH